MAPQDAVPAVTIQPSSPSAPVVQCSMPPAKAAPSASDLKAEASCKDAYQIHPECRDAESPLSSPLLTASSLLWASDYSDAPDENHWLDECKPLDGFDSLSGLEDLWSETGDFLASGPQA